LIADDGIGGEARGSEEGAHLGQHLHQGVLHGRRLRVVPGHEVSIKSTKF